jgi:hypothetical protein
LASKLPDRATHVLIVVVAATGSEKRYAIGFSNVSALHEHIQG